MILCLPWHEGLNGNSWVFFSFLLHTFMCVFNVFLLKMTSYLAKTYFPKTERIYQFSHFQMHISLALSTFINVVNPDFSSNIQFPRSHGCVTRTRCSSLKTVDATSLFTGLWRLPVAWVHLLSTQGCISLWSLGSLEHTHWKESIFSSIGCIFVLHCCLQPILAFLGTILKTAEGCLCHQDP